MTDDFYKFGNTIIAGFMGYVPHPEFENCFTRKEESHVIMALEYQTCWDYLMETVEHIKTLGYRFYLNSNEDHTEVRFTDMGVPGREVVKVVSKNTMIIAVYETVLQFIQLDKEWK